MSEIKNFKDYFKTILEMVGCPLKDGGYAIDVETFNYETDKYEKIIVPVSKFKNQNSESYPRVVVRPMVSTVPIMEGTLTDGTKFNQHESLVEITIVSQSKDEIEAVDISTALTKRLREFTSTRTRTIKDNYDWEDYQNNIKLNKGYTKEFMKNENRHLIKYGSYERKNTLEGVIENENSFAILKDGLYVNGESGLEMFEAYKGRVFKDFDTCYLRGIENIEDLTQMRELEDTESQVGDTYILELEHKVLFNVYRERPIEENIGEVHINAKGRK